MFFGRLVDQLCIWEKSLDSSVSALDAPQAVIVTRSLTS